MDKKIKDKYKDWKTGKYGRIFKLIDISDVRETNPICTLYHIEGKISDSTGSIFFREEEVFDDEEDLPSDISN